MESNSEPRRKSPLERKLIVLVALLFIGAAGLAIFTGVKIGEYHRYQKEHPNKKTETTGNVCLSQNCVKTAYGVMSAMNTSVDPCENFYEYACGQFIADHPIPDTDNSVSRFGILDKEVFAKIRVNIEAPITSKDLDSKKKAKIAFQSCMDEATINSLGDAPLRDVLKLVGGWPMMGDSMARDWKAETAMAKLNVLNYGVLINSYVYVDDKNSTVNRIQISEPSINLARDYFIDDKYKTYLAAYKQFITDVANIMSSNANTVDDDVEAQINFEIELAKIVTPASERSDPELNYNLMTLKQVQEEFKGFDYSLYLNEMFKTVDIEITEKEKVIILAKNYLPKFGKLIKKTPNRVIANYVGWSLVQYGISMMSEDLFGEIYRKYKKVMRGTVGKSPRWSTCTSYSSSDFDMVLGRMFTEKYFSKNAKDTAKAMIQTLKHSFKRIIADNHWMSQPSKIKAQAKADAINEKIGYPDFINDDEKLNKYYEDRKPDLKTFYGNRLQKWKINAKNGYLNLRKPVDHKSWYCGPAVVNAYYSANNNAITFPAGILQPPFYSEFYPKSLNYGAIGVVIGHEITHAFDDGGRRYDKFGNLHHWWSEEDVKKFKKEASCIVDQYSKFYSPVAKLHLNGAYNQGENIADNGGLKESFRAYKKWERDQGKTEPLLPGLGHTNEQLFFLGFAQVWCGKPRKQYLTRAINTDPHSPARYRVLGTVSNSPDFAKAFKCKAGAKMNPAKKCNVW